MVRWRHGTRVPQVVCPSLRLSGTSQRIRRLSSSGRSGNDMDPAYWILDQISDISEGRLPTRLQPAASRLMHLEPDPARLGYQISIIQHLAFARQGAPVQSQHRPPVRSSPVPLAAAPRHRQWGDRDSPAGHRAAQSHMIGNPLPGRAAHATRRQGRRPSCL